MSQHNIIGSEAFEGRRYIMVHHVRSGIGRRRRKPVIVISLVAIVALLAGAAAAAFALGPLLAQANAPAVSVEQPNEKAQMRLQPVETVAATQNAPQTATR